MDLLVIVLHVLAAALWIGGSFALTFVAVPVIRKLEGEARARSMRELGRRWRALGYGSLAVLVPTGLLLADDLGALHWRVLFHTDFGQVLTVKSALVVSLVVTAVLHDYVLGPRLAREIRAGGPERSRRKLVVVGWTNLATTTAIAVLGAWLAWKA